MLTLRDPRRESIIAGVREDATVPVTDAGRFRVTYHPHAFEPAPLVRGRAPQYPCEWCPAPRRSAAHPREG